MNFLAGYKTIISIGVSMVLKLLALKGLYKGDVDAGALTDQILLVISGVFDLIAMFTRATSKNPGPLAK